MVKLVQKIKRSITAQQALSKYIFYALGEIILIVMGILIALQIDNWNETNKNKEAELEFYVKLFDDLTLDRQNIARLYEESEHKIGLSKQLLLDLHRQDKDKGYLINTYAQAVRSNAFVPSKVAITDIISSGNLKLLHDDSIKNHLIRYYAELDNLLIQLEIHRTQIIDRVFSYDNNIKFGFQNTDYMTKSLGPEIMSILPVDNWHLKPSSTYYQQFQNDLVFFATMREREKQHYNTMLKAMEPIYSLLQKKCAVRE